MSAETSASSISHPVTGVDPARALERVLYRCAKQDRDRRRHALTGHVARSDVIERGLPRWRRRSRLRMPAGERCR